MTMYDKHMYNKHMYAYILYVYVDIYVQVVPEFSWFYL
jgi:hypothetical protein